MASEGKRQSLSGQFDRLVESNLDLIKVSNKAATASEKQTAAVHRQVKAIYVLLIVTCVFSAYSQWGMRQEMNGLHRDVVEILKIVSQKK